MNSQRSTEKELLDLGPEHYTQAEFDDCQNKLFKVNQLLGSFGDTVHVLKRFVDTISVMDVGCGGGLFLLHLSRRFPNMRFIGNDISNQAIIFAEKERIKFGVSASNVSFQLLSSPALTYPEDHVDVVLATMVCHHMSNEELVVFLRQALYTARLQVTINDLHRHFLAYWFYRWMSPLLFRSRLMTHDGLISIQRGFKRYEWESVLKQADIKHYQIKWCFPFRWRVTLWKK